MQHDLYSWQVLGGEFVKDELTNSSEFIDKTITNWLREVEPEQREVFIDTLFEILNATDVKTISEISSNKFSNAKTMVKAYQNLDEESKKIMIKTLGVFFAAGKSNIFPSIKERNK